jgi:hypothetical protein
MRSTIRILCAITTALGVGLLVPFCMWDAWKRATGESGATWTPVIWGDHWALRGASSLIGFGSTGFIGGAVSRKHGRVLSLFAKLPGLLTWSALT